MEFGMIGEINFDLPDEIISKVIKDRGGCNCSTSHPPCSNCTNLILWEELDDASLKLLRDFKVRQVLENL